MNCIHRWLETDNFKKRYLCTVLSLNVLLYIYIIIIDDKSTKSVYFVPTFVYRCLCVLNVTSVCKNSFTFCILYYTL